MKWFKWIFKIGWKVAYEYVNDDVIETTWVHTETKEKRTIKRRIVIW